MARDSSGISTIDNKTHGNARFTAYKGSSGAVVGYGATAAEAKADLRDKLAQIAAAKRAGRGSEGDRAARGSEHRAKAFEADKAETYRALQDARAYVTDFDRDGKKAEAIYKRLERANRVMYPWSTDGTPAQSAKAIEYINEITSILSEKIGPASRREFREQGGKR